LVSSNLKKRFEKAVAAAVKPMMRLGVTPNQVTALGLAVSLAAAWLYADWGGERLRLVYGAAAILLSGLLDAVDGVLARGTGRATRLGGFLDSVADRYSTGSLMVSYTRSRAEAEGEEMAGVGFFERAERMIFLAACSLASYRWLQALDYGMIVLAAMAHLTVAQRMLHFKKMVEKN